MRHRALIVVFCTALGLTSCGPQFKSNITPIKSPMGYATSYELDGLQIGFDVLTAEQQTAHFGVDMTRADVVPIRIVVRNDSEDEYYIQAAQVFGRTPNGDLYPAYRLDQSIDRIRKSEVGKAMASGAVAGLIIGAAVGAAAGAAIGQATSDSAGQGAAIGAAIGGTSAGISGAAAGADSTSRTIKSELRKVDWGNRVVYPAHIEHGFLFMKAGVAYDALEVLLYNVNKRKNTRISVTLR